MKYNHPSYSSNYIKIEAKTTAHCFSRPCNNCAICYTCILIYHRTEKKSHCLYHAVVQFDSYYLGMEKTHIYSYRLLVSCPMSKIYKKMIINIIFALINMHFYYFHYCG